MMVRRSIYILLTMLLAAAWTAPVSAQKYPERRFIRMGNKAYQQENYQGSEMFYHGALSQAPQSYEGFYNMGNAYYKQGRFQEAAGAYGQILQDSIPGNRPQDVCYNMGNAMFNQRQFENAVEAYKQALRINPDDQQAKFNLAYAKKMLENPDNQSGGGNDQDQQDNQDNQDQQDQDQDQQGDDQQDQNQDRQDSQGDQDNKDNQPQQDKGGMSKEEAERMLDAVQMGEDKTREKEDGKKVPVVGRSGKNW